jgi:hypothetical protein
MTRLAQPPVKLARPIAVGLVAAFLLLEAVGGLAGEKVQVKWNGNYPHNNERTFSATYQLGWSKNFMNGFPEENRVVQRDGFLPAEVFKPRGSGPFPFVVLMHGCGGMDSVAAKWVETYSGFLGQEGIGAIALDSFTTRKVKDVCGTPTEGNWSGGAPRMPTPPSSSWPRPAMPT